MFQKVVPSAQLLSASYYDRRSLMTDPSLTPDFVSGLNPDELLVYAPGLQRLASNLVGVDRAEDLLQDTWVRALEKPPTAQQPLGPWLVRVLSNLAVSSHRRRSKRHDWECGLQESQQHLTRLPSPDEIGAELEAADKVMRAVSELDELQREIITLRYLRGMPSGQIGEALELPASTVRWHIQNAVAKMRVSLSKEGRDLSDGWVACVIPLLQMSDRAVVAKLSALGAMGPLGLPVLLASLLVSFIGILAQLFVAQGTHEALRTPLTAVLARSAAPSLETLRVEDGQDLRFPAIPLDEASRQVATTEVARMAMAVEGPEIPGPRGPADLHRQANSLEFDDGEIMVQICSRIVGEDQSPLTGAELAWGRSLGGSPDGFAVAGSDGRLKLAMLDTSAMLGLTGSFEVSAAGYATRLVTWPFCIGHDVQFGDLSLVRSRPLVGFVVDTEGNPIAGASVTAANIGGKEESSPVVTDDKGRFNLLEVPRKHARVTAKSDGYQSAAIYPEDDFDGQLKLQLKRDDAAPTLALLVVDSSGLAVADAVVSLHRAAHAPATFLADKNGQLRFPLSVPTGASSGSMFTGDVIAFDPALAFAPTRRESLPLDGQQRVLKLEKGRALKFLVKNPNGAQVTGFQWFHPESIHHPSPTIRYGEVSGSSELTIAVADDDAASQSEEGIVVLARGFAPVSFEFRSAPEGASVIELLLSPEETVEVHVIQGAMPVKNAVVTVTPTGGGPLTYGGVQDAKQGEAWTYTTNAHGAFHMPQRPFQPYLLRVNAADLAPWFHHHSGMGTSVALKTILLEAGGSLVGRTPTVYLTLAGSPSPMQRTLAATHENGRVEEISVGASPFYQMHGLTPGRWTLRWLEHGATESLAEVKSTSHVVEIVAGSVTYLDH